MIDHMQLSLNGAENRVLGLQLGARLYLRVESDAGPVKLRRDNSDLVKSLFFVLCSFRFAFLL